MNKLYAVHLDVNDYIESKSTKELVKDYQDYLAHPEKYQSNFHHKVNEISLVCLIETNRSFRLLLSSTA